MGKVKSIVELEDGGRVGKAERGARRPPPPIPAAAQRNSPMGMALPSPLFPRVLERPPVRIAGVSAPCIFPAISPAVAHWQGNKDFWTHPLPYQVRCDIA